MARHFLIVVVVGMIGTLCAAPASAQLYKWVDANGVTQYSDKAPPGEKSKVTVLQAPPSAPASAGAATDWQAKDLEFRKRQVERAEAKRKADADAEEAKRSAEARREACQDARDQVNNLQGGIRVFRWNDQGEKVYMDDSERPLALQKAQQSAATNCSQ